MNDYLVAIIVFGVFPTEVKPQLTKEIRILEEFQADMKTSTFLEESMFYSKVGVNVMAVDENKAEELAEKILTEFLSFYSLTTLNHYKIIHDHMTPIEVTNLSGDRMPSPHYVFAYGIRDIDGTHFLKNILHYYPILQNEKNNYLKNAIEFLFRGRYNHDSRIALLFAVISLESIFSKSDESTEIGFRLSNRLAVLLGSDSNERMHIRKTVNQLYRMRSKLIHGTPLEIFDTQGIYVWCRQAILRFLMLAKKYPNHDSILEKIDNAMIDNEILKQIQKESSELLEIIEDSIGEIPTFRIFGPKDSPDSDSELDTDLSQKV